MPVSTSFYLLLSGLATGIAACQAVVPPTRTGRSYARTMGLVALSVLGIALLYDAWFRVGPVPRSGLDGVVGTWAVGLQWAGLVLLVIFLIRLRRDPLPGPVLPVLATLATGAGLGLAQALVVADASAALRGFTALQGLMGAAVLGTAMSAMLLGHFYLVVPGLSIVPLRHLTAGFVGVVTARLVLDGVAVGLMGVDTVWPQTSAAGPDPVGTMLVGLVPLLMRVLFGLAGALMLGVMTVKTVAIQSTQSATGILYAAVVFVLIGEFAAGYLLVARGLPL